MTDTDNELGICCAWCGIKLTKEGVEAFNGSMGCYSCGPNEAEVEITCTNPECTKYRKVIYKK